MFVDLRGFSASSQENINGARTVATNRIFNALKPQISLIISALK
jgi:hypothetical protein